jgi:hypothetical protein
VAIFHKKIRVADRHATTKRGVAGCIFPAILDIFQFEICHRIDPFLCRTAPSPPEKEIEISFKLMARRGLVLHDASDGHSIRGLACLADPRAFPERPAGPTRNSPKA